MAVLRIVANVEARDPATLAAFYRRLLGLDVLMDFGWIVTLGTSAQQKPELSVMSEGGSGAPVPALSIEVDDLDAVHARALRDKVPIAYPLTSEPWGVRRFFLRDPAGTLVNILAHDVE